VNPLAQTTRGTHLPLDLSAIDALVVRMDGDIAALRARGDRSVVFLFAYRIQTLQMRASVLAGRFADPAWVMRVTVRFAELYFSAAETYRVGDGTSCPPPWRSFFSAADHGKASPPELLLLGMNAHIVHDLALAMWDVMERAGDFAPMGTAAPMASRLSIRQFDHDMVNEVLEETIDPIQDAVAREFTWWMRVLDVAMLRLDEWVVHKFLRAARHDVWIHVMALGSARNAYEAAAVRRHLVTESMENARRIDLIEHIPVAALRRALRRWRPAFDVG
jgi:hypothetical protein